MAAKLDKETMKKQHFWLLLIPLFIGLLLAWIGLFAGVSSAIDDKAKQNDDEKKKVEAAKAQPKAMLSEYDKRKGELYDLRTQRWKEMWDLQQSVYEWPAVLGDDQIAKVKNMKFGDEIFDSSFLSNFQRNYADEYKNFAKEVDPLQFAGGWQAALRHVPAGAWRKVPVSEDVWLAMEDFWVEREMVRTLNEVNKAAGRFEEVKTDKADPRHKKFANRVWEVDLALEDKPAGPTLTGTIRNKTDRLQPYNTTNELVLNVWLTAEADARPFRFPIEGVSQPGGTTQKITYVPQKHTVLEGAAQGIYRVEQVYDVRTAPVKRLDQLRLGYLSSRHSDAELQMTAFSAKAAESAAADTGAGTGAGGGGFGPQPGMVPGGTGKPGMPGAGGFGEGGFGGAVSSPDYTENGLARRRYIHRTDQVRAMPIGLSLIADQAYVQDVLTALANSKLRFQTVQTHLSRFRGVLSYLPTTTTGGGFGRFGGFPGIPGFGGGSMPGEGEEQRSEGGSPPGAPPAPGLPGQPGGGSSDFGRGGSGPRSGVPGFPGMPGMPGFPGFPGGGSFPGMGGGFFGGLRSSTDDQVAGNLVELGVYGITSLYEKFQPEGEKKDEAAAAPMSPAGAPAAPTGAPSVPAAGTPTGPMPPAGTPMPPAGTPGVPPAAGTPAAPTGPTDPTKK
jgi:hypothetical protein